MSKSCDFLFYARYKVLLDDWLFLLQDSIKYIRILMDHFSSKGRKKDLPVSLRGFLNSQETFLCNQEKANLKSGNYYAWKYLEILLCDWIFTSFG